jgi:fructose-bisphosphate aldolase, class II
MTIATLSEVLRPCLRDGSAVAGLVVLGWEDARAYVMAAEAEARPVILQAGPGCRAHTPLAVLGAMFRHLAEQASVPVVAHLDHGETLEVCRAAIGCGFTSVMYDGSALTLAENISNTAEIVQMAHDAGVSVEAELGYVGYAQGADSRGTDPGQVAQFRAETGVDALAVSVGNRHLMTEVGAQINMERLHAIAAQAPDLPLVLHGGSGIAPADRLLLAQGTTVCKFNIGTELRQAFGAALRHAVLADPARFDRNQILAETVDPVVTAARQVIRGLVRADHDPARDSHPRA